VWIAARRATEGGAVADEVTAAGSEGRFVACTVDDPTSVDETVAHVVARSGHLDGLAHNATSGRSPIPGHLAELPTVDLGDHVAVSLRGTSLVARATLPHLEATGGSLLVLTSEAGFEGKARLPAYPAVKAAQRGLARAWGRGVRVNCLAPLAATPAMVTAMAADPAMEAQVLGRNPLGRLGDAVTDVGPVARFLLGPETAFVTGATLMADGGSCPIT
jgi:3-oxoacyl-[acyl-carrier protein] reductase